MGSPLHFRPTKSGGVVVPHTPTFWQRGAAWLVFLLVRAVAATLRYKLDDRSAYFENGNAGPAIYAGEWKRISIRK